MSTPSETTPTTAETYEFQTEARQLLDLMVHAIYSNKDIFLRELISNASDALDKRRFEAIAQPELLGEGTELQVRIEPDTEAHTLTVWDNGIGMSDAVVAKLRAIDPDRLTPLEALERIARWRERWSEPKR